MGQNTGKTASLCLTLKSLWFIFNFYAWKSYFHISGETENMNFPIFPLPSSKKTVVALVPKKPVVLYRQRERESLWMNKACFNTVASLLAMLYQANSCCLSAKACWLPGLGFHTHWILHKALYFWLMVLKKTPPALSWILLVEEIKTCIRRNKNMYSCLTQNLECLDKL